MNADVGVVVAVAVAVSVVFRGVVIYAAPFYHSRPHMPTSWPRAQLWVERADFDIARMATTPVRVVPQVVVACSFCSQGISGAKGMTALESRMAAMGPRR